MKANLVTICAFVLAGAAMTAAVVYTFGSMFYRTAHNDYLATYPMSRIGENCPEGALSLHLIDGSISYVSVHRQAEFEYVIGKPHNIKFVGCRSSKEWFMPGTSIYFIELTPTFGLEASND